MKKTSGVVWAVMYLVLGILFWALKSEVVGIAMNVMGFAFLVLGILDFVKKRVFWGLLKIITALIIFLAGCKIVETSGVIMGAVLVAWGVVSLVRRLASKKKRNGVSCALGVTIPIACFCGGVFLLTGGIATALTWAFVVAGGILILTGGLAVVDALIPKNK